MEKIIYGFTSVKHKRILYVRNIFLFVVLQFFIFSCVSNQSYRCWKIMKEEECIPLKAYKKWNECIIQCDNKELQSKTKDKTKEKTKENKGKNKGKTKEKTKDKTKGKAKEKINNFF